MIFFFRVHVCKIKFLHTLGWRSKTGIAYPLRGLEAKLQKRCLMLATSITEEATAGSVKFHHESFRETDFSHVPTVMLEKSC